MKRFAIVLAVLSILCSSAQAQRFHRRKVSAQAKPKATATLHGVTVTWAASPSTTNGDCVSPCVITYNVFRGTVSGGENLTTPINSAPIAALTFIDSNVVVGNTYVYEIQAEEFPNGIAAGAPLFSKTNSPECAAIVARALPLPPPSSGAEPH